MKSDRRVELLRLFSQLGERYPNWRFGQIVANVAGMADVDIWDVEDEQLMEAGKNHLEIRSSATEAVLAHSNS